MKRKEMRLQFNRDGLKDHLEELAAALQISLNELVNMILSAHFSEKERLTFDLSLQLLEFQQAQDFRN